MKRQDVLKKTLHEAMSDRSFLTPEGLSLEAMRERLSRDEFTEMIYVLEDRTGRNGRFRVQDVLDICTEYLPELAKTPPEGWAEHCRLYLRGQLFPHLPGPSCPDRWRKGRAFLLHLLRALYACERETLPFDPAFDLRLLNEQEICKQGFTTEYNKLRHIIRSRYLYEFLRISADITPHNLLQHTGGVHYAALFVARQLSATGFPVDLALLSAAAASHDIGKFGCRPEEEHRAPHLHFYYTDYCLSRFALPTVSHIAANHSTWDLEPENLSIESLLLIYADLRVPSSEDAEERLRFCSLEEAFARIVETKNPDEDTRRRYLHVYGKLRDFEDFLRENGIVVDFPDNFAEAPQIPRMPLRRLSAAFDDEGVLRQLKFHAIDHNLRLMARLNRYTDFSDLIDRAAGEVQWKKIRTYVTILDEYSAYMTEAQKDLALRFLYEKLTHRESDIREHAAHIMGRIIAHYREDYKKGLPRTVPAPDSTGTNLYTFEKYLSLFMEPSNEYTEVHRARITANVDFFVSAVLHNCRADCRHRYLDLLENYYCAETCDEARIITLCSTALALNDLSDAFLRTLKFFIKDVLGSYSRDVDLIALDGISRFFADESGIDMNARRRALLGFSDGALSKDRLASLYLDGLKESTSWIVKIAYIDFLLTHAGELPDLLRPALHFVNLLKVSETISVRKKAGKALLVLADHLPVDQRNDLAVALFDGLELGDYQFARFIPDCLGRLMLKLPGREFDETLVQLNRLLDTCNEKYAAPSLATIAVALEHYREYAFADDPQAETRKNRLLNLIVKGMACYDEGIFQAAFRILGEHIFGSSVLTAAEKSRLICHSAHRLLALLPKAAETHDLLFYNNAAVLNKLYRFLASYQSDGGRFDFPAPRRVAFFQSSFDPFTREHKAIAVAIRDLDYDVYLSLDEAPHHETALAYVPRRRILAMSIADEEGLHLFPEDLPVNLGCPEDLDKLTAFFAGREVFVAADASEIGAAPHYRKPSHSGSVHGFPHILFSFSPCRKCREEEEAVLTGEIVRLTLRQRSESGKNPAAHIRESLLFDRDTEALLAPFARRYLFLRGESLREGGGKPSLRSEDFRSEYFCPCAQDKLLPLAEEMSRHDVDFARFLAYVSSPGVRTVLLLHHDHSSPAAVACAHPLAAPGLPDEFCSSSFAGQLHREDSDKTAVIGMLYASGNRSNTELHELALSELLSALAAEGYTRAVYRPADRIGFVSAALNASAQFGFINIADEGSPLYAVDMRNPIVLLRDVETALQAPFHENPRIKKVLSDTRRKLAQALTALYPERLILSLSAGMLRRKMVDLIVAAKEEGRIPDNALIVPYGKSADGITVPHTTVKALHAEKYFRNDLSGFIVRESVDSAPLRQQAHALASCRHPLVPVDDLLHRGERLHAILPLLREEGLTVSEVVCGLLTGAAQVNAGEQVIPVEHAYFLPSVSLCLHERDCYPFLGGDFIQDEDGTCGAQTIHRILPYAAGEMEGISREEYSLYSVVCLENAVDILRVLEQEFEAVFEKKLTLRRLGAVIDRPFRPLLGAELVYEEERAPSFYAENALRLALRLSR